MNLLLISFKYLIAKPLSSFLNILILSLGIAIIILLLLVSKQFEGELSKNSKGLDLVVGAKGSPMQLVLCNIFHIDFPTGNIPLPEAEKLAKNPMVKKAIPLALGDSYESFRIVGTNHKYPEHYEVELSKGGIWEHEMEVTVGSSVARKLNLKIGDSFNSAHGMGNAVGHEHENSPFVVKGIFKPSGSVIDNLILTNIQSIWAVHEHKEEEENENGENHDDHEHHHETNENEFSATGLPLGDEDEEITSLLIKFKSPMAAITMPRIINENTEMQAASPAFEITRLFSLLGVGIDIMEGFAYLMIFIAILSIFIALYNALKERKYDLAIMRSLGSSKSKLFVLVIIEGILITLLSAIVGLMLGHGVVVSIGYFLEDGQKTGITGLIFLPEEILIVLGAIFIGIITAFIPAIQAYKTDISKILAQG
ncbi:MAG: ABC transporter permease [Flammeovirgaceae bacterium]|nr:ABC transporter permease [Flammeovirgaceae bacterium]